MFSPKLNEHELHSQNEAKLQLALKLIKLEMDECVESEGLHRAVQLIVDVVRTHGYCQR